MKLIGLKDIYFLSVIMLIQIVSWLPSYRLKNFLVHLISYCAYYFSTSKRRRSEQGLAKVFVTLRQSLIDASRIYRRKLLKAIKAVYEKSPNTVKTALVKWTGRANRSGVVWK